MKPFLLIFLLVITPLSSVFAYENYDIDTDYVLETDPTVCHSAPMKDEVGETIIKTAISNWENGLKDYTNNYDVWNISYWFLDENEISSDELNLTPCDIIIIFTSSLTESSGITGKLQTNQTFIEISTQFEFTDAEFSIILQHELGHAFGLGHYTTTNEVLFETWMNGINIPSIMAEIPPPFTQDKITELDLEMIVSIYGSDGFSKIPPGGNLPVWIQNLYNWNDEGLLEDLELVSAIDYLVANGIIEII